jgi:hypothetical protein
LNIALQRNDVFTEGLACRVLGHVRAKRNPRDPEALLYMRRSRELLDAGGCYVEAARTLVDWGILERRAGDLNGNDRLVEAQRIFQAMNLKWETERVRSLLDQQ